MCRIKKKNISVIVLCTLFYSMIGMDRLAENGTKKDVQKVSRVASLFDQCMKKVLVLENWQEAQLPNELLQKIASAQMKHAPAPPSPQRVKTSSEVVKIYNPVITPDSIFYISPSFGFGSMYHINCYDKQSKFCLCIRACSKGPKGRITSLITNPSNHKEVVYAIKTNLLFFNCINMDHNDVTVGDQEIVQLCWGTDSSDSVWAADQTGVLHHIQNKEHVESIQPEQAVPVGICLDQENKPLIGYRNGTVKKIIDSETVQVLANCDAKLFAMDLNHGKNTLLLARDNTLTEHNLGQAQQSRVIGMAPGDTHFTQCLYIDERTAVTVDVGGGIRVWDLRYGSFYEIEAKRFEGNRPNASRVAYQAGLLAYDKTLLSIGELLAFIKLPPSERAAYLKKRLEQKKKASLGQPLKNLQSE